MVTAYKLNPLSSEGDFYNAEMNMLLRIGGVTIEWLSARPSVDGRRAPHGVSIGPELRLMQVSRYLSPDSCIRRRRVYPRRTSMAVSAGRTSSLP